ncbi:MAG: deoxyribonuclease IV [Armatimonadetes bacterium]|nr:deoxyribonuclease IV [Armatimonadota bacterium]MDW8121893.1 deoxyribonuclease IV [Armatimonadota bacterium]
MALVGAHMPTQGRPEKALHLGAQIGCEIVQLFVKNPRQWRGQSLDWQIVDYFLKARSAYSFPLIVAHAGYLINLASPDPDVARQSFCAAADEVSRCLSLGIDAIVFHPGAHSGSGATAAIAQFRRQLTKIVDIVQDHPMLVLIENSAGQGTSIGHRLEELAQIIEGFSEERVGLCLDTAHLYAAGYDISRAEGRNLLANEIERTVGWSRLRLLHFNDTLKGLGSRVDRHWHIGDGNIGGDGFSFFLHHPRFRLVPGVIETPQAPFRHPVNLRRLKELRDRSVG